MKKYTNLALLTALVSMSTAFAATSSLPTEIDPDQDGAITRDEFNSLRNARAFEGDENGDGLLSQSEFAPMFPARVPRSMHGRAFAQFDTSGDGYVDTAELAAGPARVFDKADKNGDNTISGEEIDSFRSQLEELGMLTEQ